MIVRKDSPLCSLPVGLTRKQTLFLDGIRIAAESVDLIYSRLTKTLLHATEMKDAEAGSDVSIVAAVQDAWAIVDSTHRLRTLLFQMPGVKQKAPGLQVFYRGTKSAERLRHLVQHLDSEIDRLVELGAPL